MIIAPHFDKTTIDLGNNNKLEIIAHDLSNKNIYIKKVLLNGKELNRSWFRHTEIKDGGKLEFFMANKPDNSWEKELPSGSVSK